MLAWLLTQIQRVSVKSEEDKQYGSSCWLLSFAVKVATRDNLATCFMRNLAKEYWFFISSSQEVEYWWLVTSVKIKQNPTNKFTQSEPRFFIRFICSRGSHYMHWRSQLMTIVKKPIKKTAGIVKIPMIIASLIPKINFKPWLCLVVVLNNNCLVTLL